MTIYVNARFLTQELTGVQRFAEQVSLALNTQRNDLIFVSPDGIIRKDVAEKLNVKIIPGGSGHLWEQFNLPSYLRREDLPLLLNLGSTAPAFYKNKIMTHHDVTYKRFPQSYSRKFRLLYNSLIPLMLRSSKHVITVSEFSKQEIAKVYNFPKEKISVVYNAVGDEFSHSFNSNKENYLLAVSSPNFHKNFHGMIEAFIALNKENGVKLKIIGKASTSFSTMDFSEYLSTSDKVEFMGRVDDAQLIALYQNSLAFIFPSFYEGFGLPPLEAQACGCPVMSSNQASMPEVLKRSVLYFDPANIDDMTRVMEKIISDAEVRNDLISAGYENVKRFSWEKSASKVSELLNFVS
ncbi:glycosyltransferase family 4 protein [Serratia quinivorans]|uniref:glycosyltransferase family 4 protein n=1 Tax=Serratia quinivorans TaxID=137545 RepID=UPI002178E3A7|nr:glycosyltransferase family 1 protein [Serratia quinivorans]CAI0763550.1 Glycogen synthase [Serratia quinivorans]CAI1564165.1 Glycogen synthase [Serratia quinivorans]